MRSSIIAALGVAAICAAAPVLAGEKLSPAAQLDKMLEGRVAGMPRGCIAQSSVRQSTVIDKTAIVYRIGSTLWVNRPRGGAESLDDDDVLVTRLTGGQLCSIDAVELRDRSSFMYNGFVSLGEFVPYRAADTD